jgi:hypothetical protein
MRKIHEMHSGTAHHGERCLRPIIVRFVKFNHRHSRDAEARVTQARVQHTAAAPQLRRDNEAWMRVARNRRPSKLFQLERLVGYDIIAPRRSNSAHLHRSERGTSV